MTSLMEVVLISVDLIIIEGFRLNVIKIFLGVVIKVE